MSMSDARVMRLRDLSTGYDRVSGNMQMRRTGLWLVWDLARLNQDIRQRVARNNQTTTFVIDGEAPRILEQDELLLSQRFISDNDATESSLTTVCFIEFANRV